MKPGFPKRHSAERVQVHCCFKTLPGRRFIPGAPCYTDNKRLDRLQTLIPSENVYFCLTFLIHPMKKQLLSLLSLYSIRSPMLKSLLLTKKQNLFEENLLKYMQVTLIACISSDMHLKICVRSNSEWNWVPYSSLIQPIGLIFQKNR